MTFTFITSEHEKETIRQELCSTIFNPLQWSLTWDLGPTFGIGVSEVHLTALLVKKAVQSWRRRLSPKNYPMTAFKIMAAKQKYCQLCGTPRAMATQMWDAVQGTELRRCAKFQANPHCSFGWDACCGYRQTDRQTDRQTANLICHHYRRQCMSVN